MSRYGGQFLWRAAAGRPLLWTAVLWLAFHLVSRAEEPAAGGRQANSGAVLTNPSFEAGTQPGKNKAGEKAVDGTLDEDSLPGWVLWFRRQAEEPLLAAAEVAVIEDEAKAHSGKKFLRMQTQKRDIYLRSPPQASYEPGLYEVSAWVRGRPGTIGAFSVDALGANFGAGIQGIDENWRKFSLVVYSPGVKQLTFPEQAQLFLGMFAPGERGQIANPQLDVDDLSVTRLSSGLADALGDHMVLQRERPVPIWGWTERPGQKVTVEFAGQMKTATADGDGRWMCELAPLKAGGPHVLMLDGRAAAYDVLVGDVWICSGQSNMEMGIDKLNGEFGNAPDAIAEAQHPQIRLWQAAKQFSATPAHNYLTHQSGYPADYQGRWEICTPENVAHGVWGGFSAVGYYFGRAIEADQKVPIGLMMIANGGTQIESFVSEPGLKAAPQADWIVPPLEQAARDGLKNPQPLALPAGAEGTSAAYREMAAGHAAVAVRQGSPDGNAFHYASSAFNGLVAPVVPYAVRGVLWYQGEHNGSDVHYEAKLKALIADWRQQFRDPKLPFIIAQLPYWRTDQPARWPLVREAQLRVSQNVPLTGLAVTIDLGDAEGDGYGMGAIHPKRKREVGERMALAARSVVYGEKVIGSGPVFRKLAIGDGKATLEFDAAGPAGAEVGARSALVARGGPLTGFQIAGADRKFFPALAVIDGDKIVVSAKEVPQPVAVRYGFAQAVLPVPNLYNREDLPATPFRTDDWAE